MQDSNEDRSAMAVAMAWASQITAISVEMVLPGLGGLWLDRKFNTTPLLTLLGFALGLTAAIWHLIRITKNPTNGDSHQPDETSDSETSSK